MMNDHNKKVRFILTATASMKHDASEGQREGNRGIAVDVGRAERTSENSRGRSRREKIPDVHIKEKWTTAQNS